MGTTFEQRGRLFSGSDFVELNSGQDQVVLQQPIHQCWFDRQSDCLNRGSKDAGGVEFGEHS